MENTFFTLDQIKSVGIEDTSSVVTEVKPIEESTTTIETLQEDPVIESTSVEETTSTSTDNNGYDPKEETDKIVNKNFHNTIKPFVSFLSERGIIVPKDKEGNDIEITNFDQLGDVLKNNIESTRISENLNEKQKEYFEALEHGIPLNEFETTFKALESLSSINVDFLKENKQARFDLLCQDLIDKGMAQDRAVKTANAFMSDEESSIADALGIVEETKAKLKGKYDELKSTVKEANKITLEKLTQIAETTTEVLGIPLTAEFKSKLIKNMTTRAGENSNGTPLNSFDKWRADNAEKAELILNTLMLYTDGFTKLEKVKATVKSNTIKELENSLRSNPSNVDNGNSFIHEGKQLVFIK